MEEEQELKELIVNNNAETTFIMIGVIIVLMMGFFIGYSCGHNWGYSQGARNTQYYHEEYDKYPSPAWLRKANGIGINTPGELKAIDTLIEKALEDYQPIKPKSQ